MWKARVRPLQHNPRLSEVQPRNYTTERDGQGEAERERGGKKKSCFLLLIGFEGCARPEHDTDSCSLLAIDKTLKPGGQFVAQSVSVCLHDQQEGEGEGEVEEDEEEEEKEGEERRRRRVITFIWWAHLGKMGGRE